MNTLESQPPEKLSLYSTAVSPKKKTLISDYASESGSVLDIGCGNGLYGLYLQALGCEVLQVDLADRRAPSAKHIPFITMDANELQMIRDSYDYIMAFDVMEHLNDDAKFLSTISRICRKRLFLSVPNIDDEQVSRIGLTHKHHKDKTHKREYSQIMLEELVSQSGFTILEIRPNLNTHLSNFARALAKHNLAARVAAKLLTWQCQFLLRSGLFENRTIGDWYCVAEADSKD